MIKLNDLAIGYNGEAILEHIDQEFDDGLIYGILAKSGAGKTTLLKTISGLLHPVHGEVVIDGTTYRNADKNPVYMMHQRYSNFGWLSCTENVLIAQRDKKLRSRDDAIKVLAAVGLEQYADKWPSQLSGGMQQRLALARTLYVKPKYLLMDEPLSAWMSSSLSPILWMARLSRWRAISMPATTPTLDRRCLLNVQRLSPSISSLAVLIRTV